MGKCCSKFRSKPREKSPLVGRSDVKQQPNPSTSSRGDMLGGSDAGPRKAPFSGRRRPDSAQGATFESSDAEPRVKPSSGSSRSDSSQGVISESSNAGPRVKPSPSSSRSDSTQGATFESADIGPRVTPSSGSSRPDLSHSAMPESTDAGSRKPPSSALPVPDSSRGATFGSSGNGPRRPPSSASQHMVSSRAVRLASSDGSRESATPSSSHSLDSTRGISPRRCWPVMLSQQGGASVFQLLDDQVVKNGTRVRPSEAQAMNLVLKQTDLLLPEILFSEFKSGNGLIHMTLIPGRPLRQVWSGLDSDSKQKICDDVWSYITKMRTITPPVQIQQYLHCSADGLGTSDPLLQGGPFLNDTALRQQICKNYLENNGQRHAEDLPNMLPRSSTSVFTHGDMAPRNILVDDRVQITGVVDWERAGWYPDYWEYANIMGPAGRYDDWQTWMDRTAPQDFKCDLEGINAARRVLF